MLYCWRCKTELPMLDEREWDEIDPLLSNAIQSIQEYRRIHKAPLNEARERGYGKAALDRYFELTGFKETSSDALWHHRISLYGPPCKGCGKPLRTPRASFCAACGADVDSKPR